MAALDKVGGGTIIDEDTFNEMNQVELGFFILGKSIFNNRMSVRMLHSFKIFGYGMLALFFGIIFLFGFLYPDIYNIIISNLYYRYISFALIALSLISLGLHNSIQKSFCKNCGNYFNFWYENTHRIRKLSEGLVIDRYERSYKCKKCGFHDIKIINRIVNPSIDEDIEYKSL